MYNLYLDESGECSFSETSGFQYFVVAVLSIEDSENQKLRNRLKRIFGKIIKDGWPKDKEIKAYQIFNNNHYGSEYVEMILDTIVSTDSAQISYLAINKDKVKNETFRNAPYGVGYNYFTGDILKNLVFEYDMIDIRLTYDERSKEAHPNQKYQQYLETLIYGRCLELDRDVSMVLDGADSKQVYGLNAVDFISWSVYRKFAVDDDRYFDRFADRILYKNEVYI